MASLVTDLARFLDEVGAEPFEVGWSDCAGMVARWLARRGCPAATTILPIRGDGAVAARLIAADGGLRAHMTRRAGHLGLRSVTQPEPGDVACLQFRGGAESGAICCGRTWALRTQRGIGRVRTAAVVDQIIWRL